MSAIVERLKRTEHPLGRTVLLRTRSLSHYALRGHRPRRMAVERYLASTERPLLQIGSGPKTLPAWLNSDLITGDIYLDIDRPLALPSDSFAFAFGEHVIEHISEASGLGLLAELHRVLRPGGVVRLTTPDLRRIISIYEDQNDVIDRASYARFLERETGRTHEHPCQILNNYLRFWGHRYVYDQHDLSAKLAAVGFVDVHREQPGESRHELLRGVERHGSEPWVNHAEAMCLEATRR